MVDRRACKQATCTVPYDAALQMVKLSTCCFLMLLLRIPVTSGVHFVARLKMEKYDNFEVGKKIKKKLDKTFPR